METHSSYYCLRNLMNRGLCQATVHGITRVGHDLATKQQKHLWYVWLSYCYGLSYHCGWKRKLRVISIVLNLLRLVLWPNTLFIMVSIPCMLEKNVYSRGIGWNVLHMSVLHKSNISLLTFFGDVLSIVESWVLMSHGIISLPISCFKSGNNTCFYI